MDSPSTSPDGATDAACLEAIGTQLTDGTITSRVAWVSARDQLVAAMEINRAGDTTVG